MPVSEVVELSRLQFAITALYHFLFVPLTLGLSSARRKTKLALLLGVVLLLFIALAHMDMCQKRINFAIVWIDLSSVLQVCLRLD